MNREVHVRFWESEGAQFPLATHPLSRAVGRRQHGHAAGHPHDVSEHDDSRRAGDQLRLQRAAKGQA